MRIAQAAASTSANWGAEGGRWARCEDGEGAERRAGDERWGSEENWSMAQQMAGRAREGAGNAMGGCLGEVGDGSWEEEGRGRGGGGWWGWTIAVPLALTGGIRAVCWIWATQTRDDDDMG